MEREKPQPITWQQLKDFVASIPDELLGNNAHIIVEGEGLERPLLEPFFMDRNIYCNKADYEDSGTLKDLKCAHGEDFKRSDYNLVTKKGTPCLWAE